MEILVVRHGPAGDRAQWAKTGRPDAQRPLTADGRRRAAQAAAGLAAQADVALIAASPWTRAKETAALLGRALGAPVVECPALVPTRPLADTADWLAECGAKKVALVGHEPHLSRLISWLLTGRPQALLALKKSGAVLLRASTPAAGKARLVWALPPRVLRRIG